MLTLKNDPETRKYAIASHDEIKREDHVKWLEKNLMFFQVVDAPSERIGAIRIFGNEISIWIDIKYRGLGVATAVIKQVATNGMYAKVVDGNVASLRAFTKAGFLPVGHSSVDKCYILKK
jgi:RimJ/RimL family protein N-acetyltransferase